MTRLNAPRTSLWPKLLGLAAAVFILLQLIPYGRAHSNPAVQATPNWANAETKALFDRACADCHSHESKWPWYSNVAPVSWFIQKHVDEGRSKFNVSVPGFGKEAEEAAEEVEKGSMPLPSYLPMHPEARLTETEKAKLIAGLEATFGKGEEGKGEQGETEEEEEK